MKVVKKMRRMEKNKRVFSNNVRGVGRNRNLGGNKPGSGPGGYCVCPNCGNKVEHTRATPCFQQSCPKCGSAMIKE